MSTSESEPARTVEATVVPDDAGRPGQGSKGEQSEQHAVTGEVLTGHRKLSLPADDELNAGRSQEAEHTEDEHAGASTAYPEPAEEESVVHPPDFRPFFTVIEDSETNEHVHPNVHYIFTDDDDELLTGATLESLSLEGDVEHHEDGAERIVLVDMTADGREVLSISSLSPEWQALKIKIVPAPSWGGGEAAADRGLMLRISGREVGALGSAKGKSKKGDVDGMMRAFDGHLEILDEVLGSTAIDAPAAEQDELL